MLAGRALGRRSASDQGFRRGEKSVGVDGIVKGLKQPDWPADGWQALQRLAGMVCAQCTASASSSGRASHPVKRTVG